MSTTPDEELLRQLPNEAADLSDEQRAALEREFDRHVEKVLEFRVLELTESISPLKKQSRKELMQFCGAALCVLRDPSLLLAILQADLDEDDEGEGEGEGEGDAVPVPVMDRWLTHAILELQDEDAREQLLDEEREEQRLLPAAIRTTLAGLDLGS